MKPLDPKDLRSSLRTMLMRPHSLFILVAGHCVLNQAVQCIVLVTRTLCVRLVQHL